MACLYAVACGKFLRANWSLKLVSERKYKYFI